MTVASGYTGDKTAMTQADFLLWTRYGDTRTVKGAYVHGTRQRDVERKLQTRYYSPFCLEKAARDLATSAVSTAPRHMRSDVDRIVFGREMDASETAEVGDGQGGTWDKGRIEAKEGAGVNGLMDRLAVQRAAAGPRPSTTWAGPSASYISVHPLNIHTRSDEVWSRRVGAARPSRVQPRPLSAIETLRAVKLTPLYAAEMDRFARARIQSELKRPAPPRAPWDR